MNLASQHAWENIYKWGLLSCIGVSFLLNVDEYILLIAFIVLEVYNN